MYPKCPKETRIITGEQLNMSDDVSDAEPGIKPTTVFCHKCAKIPVGTVTDVFIGLTEKGAVDDVTDDGRTIGTGADGQLLRAFKEGSTADVMRVISNATADELLDIVSLSTLHQVIDLILTY